MNKEFSLEIIASRLPDDILKQMYNDHFHPKQRFNKIIHLLKSKQCRTLQGGCIELSTHLKRIFETRDVDLLLYALKHADKFDIVYKQIIIENKKHFTVNDTYILVNNNKYTSMAVAWLFALYYQ